MWVYLILYTNFYISCFPSYIEPEFRVRNFDTKEEATRFMNAAIEGHCAHVVMDSVYLDFTFQHIIKK